MMLFYKAWRESQVRFLSAAAALGAWCIFLVLFPALAAHNTGRTLSQFLGLPYSVFVYNLIFDGTGKALFVLLIIFLGLGGLLRERAHHTAVFTLALPVSRGQLIRAQVIVGLAELVPLALLPALLIQPLSALVHESYPFADAFRFGLLRFICGTVIFATSFFLSVVLRGEYTAAVACYLAVSFDALASNWERFHPYHTNIMRTIAARWDWSQRGPDLSGPLPWTLLSAMMLIGLALFAAAARITQKQTL